jgi:tRNA1Val (adenine37-N6)-methyltransferase
MRERLFRFQQFAVRHQLSAMKVGTDGVSLGAWAGVGRRTLDAGCGCGLIGLMAAQRGAERVVLVDVDAPSAEEAAMNVAASPWADRMSVIRADYLNCEELDAAAPFDAIVCNPPFFATGERAPQLSRATARHEGTLTPEAFFSRAAALLAPGNESTVSIIVPTDRKAAWTFAASVAGLTPRRIALLVTRPGEVEPRRVMMEFSRGADPGAEQLLRIDSAEYQALVAPFYLPKT